ncbi:MAG: hypothetical protein AAF620_20500 [Bacteroidota bacterium]
MAYSKVFIEAVEKHLKFHRIIGDTLSISNRNLKSYVLKFQEKANIYADGIIGPETLWELQFPLVLSSKKLNWVRCEADKIVGIDGFNSFLFREDAAARYNLIRKEVLRLGGSITSSGGKRELTANVNEYRSSKSMHYVGLAFDLSITSGFFDPQRDPFVIVENKIKSGPYWKVYCRAPGGDAMTLNAVYWESWGSGITKKIEITGNFIDFTDLAGKHGFHPIPPRSGFLRGSNKKYLSSEWWHFQANDLLVPMFSQFGIELLKIEDYSPQYLKHVNSKIWNNKKVVYKQNWW